MGQAESKQEQFWEACGFGHVDKVRSFIADGVDVNWVSKTHDSSPIHVASQGKQEIVKMLIDAGCDVNARDERQCTALHHAAMNGFIECATLLISAGAVVNVQDKNKWTPLHCAAYWAHPAVTELLLEHKADVTLQNKDSRLAIHEAARSKSEDAAAVGRTAKLLIDAGSDVAARCGTHGFTDFTVLMFACYHGHIEVVKHLLTARCEVNAQSSNNWTALHWAADQSHVDIVELLLQNNADATLVGSRSETARDRATTDRMREVFDKFSGIKLRIDDLNKSMRRKHCEADEGPMPDIKDFPSHLKEEYSPLEPCVNEEKSEQKNNLTETSHIITLQSEEEQQELMQKSKLSSALSTSSLEQPGSPQHESDVLKQEDALCCGDNTLKTHDGNLISPPIVSEDKMESV